MVEKDEMVRKISATGLLAAFSVVATTVPAFADPSYTAYDLLDSFNVITSGNFTTSSETEGNVLIGGNLTNGSGGVANKGGTAFISVNLSSYFSQVSIYGDAAGSWTTTAGNNVQIGGSNTASFANAGPVTANASFAISSTEVQQVLSNLSTSLAGQSGTSISPTSGQLTFTGAKTGGTDYFTISLAQLQTASSVGFDIGTDSVVINVTGTGSFTQDFNFIGSPMDIADNVIWNFEGATSLAITTYYGTILALNASVTNTSYIDGTLASASFDGSGEVHSFSYKGNQPPVTPPVIPPVVPPVTPVPEPASAAVFLAALLGLAGCRQAFRA